MRVLGVANHGPEQLLTHLFKVYSLDIQDITIVPLDGNLSQISSKNTTLLFLCSRDFFRHLRYLKAKRSYKTVDVYVLGSSQTLYGIEGLIPTDYLEIDSTRFYDFELLSFFLPINTPDLEVSLRSENYIDLLTKKVQNGSILTQLMTSIYTIPKSVNQRAITLGICEWFVFNRPNQSLLDFFNANSKTYGLSAKVRQRLEDILLSEVASNFQKAFKELNILRESGTEITNILINSIAENNEVPAFEIRYITIKYENENLYKNENKRSVDNLVDGKSK